MVSLPFTLTRHPETLRNFRFAEGDTFMPQVERYGEGFLAGTVGKAVSIMQDKAYLPERYLSLIEFAQGRRGA